ncbi:MAG: rod shape-determining protein RodA [Synergistaceae bacterium]|nr:rod shape-determining protein RodA [Candidatus Equadaptatus faecalis]
MQVFENSWLDIKRGLNRYMFFAAVILFLLGAAAIYSASYSLQTHSSPYMIRQLVFGLIGFVVYFLIIKIGCKNMLKLAFSLSVIVILLFLLVLIVGHTSKGAQSWFNFGFIRLQPSEIGKLAFALLLAKCCTMFPPSDLKGIALVFGISLCFLLPILLQPDFGSALVYSVMFFAVLIVAGAPAKFLFGIMGAGIAMLPVGWLMLKPYQKMRILVFFDASVDPQGAGYNVIQSRIAVGSGGIFGKGFLNGTQSKLRFLPEPHTDFIFGVFSEEFGFVGCFFVLVLYALLLWKIIEAITSTRDPEARLLCTAIAAWLWFQMTESIAMCMGLAPVTGLPLPLFSYGGSSLLAVLAGLALVQSVEISLAKERF